MHKQTLIDQIEVTRDGTLGVRIAKEVIDDDGVTVLQRGWHRTTLPPGIDIDKQMEAVNLNLTNDLRFPPVPDDGIKRIKDVAKLTWTAKVIKAYAEAHPPQVEEQAESGKKGE